MTDPETPTGHQSETPTGQRPAQPDEVMTAPFAPGVRVALRQYLREGGQPRCRELGLGEIAVRPRLGERLEIRIRAERGLASSRIRELELIEKGRLAVVTNGRVYLLSRIDAHAGAGSTELIQAAVTRLLREHAESNAGDLTEYVRIGGELAEHSPSPFVGREIQIERFSRGDAEAKSEPMGTGTLLGEPEPGLPLRFLNAEGQVVTTSDVVSIERDAPEVLEVRTANRCYRFTLESEGS